MLTPFQLRIALYLAPWVLLLIMAGFSWVLFGSGEMHQRTFTEDYPAPVADGCKPMQGGLK